MSEPTQVPTPTEPVDAHTGDLEVTLLDRAPSIVPLFARGVATGLRRPGARGTLPVRRLVLPGVEQDVRRLADYQDLTGGVLSDRVPATWLHVLTFPLQIDLMSARDFPFPMLGMVHVTNSMTQHRPVRVDDVLTLTSWSENLSPHRKGHTVDLVGQAHVGHELVWEGRSTYLVRGTSEAGADSAPRPERDQGIDAEVAPPLPELAQWRLPADLGRRYAGIAGDANPIHLYALTAKALGFPRAIAHGMWSHAKLLAALQSRLPGAFTVDVEFRKPVLLPSTVSLRGGLADGSGTLAVTSRDGSREHLKVQVTSLDVR